MGRYVTPGRSGWFALLGGLALGALLDVVFLRVAPFHNSWEVLGLGGLIVICAGMPYVSPSAGRSGRPWRYLALAVGAALCVGALVGVLVQG